MSITMTGSEDDTDYSSFEYQQVAVECGAEGGINESNPRVTAVANVEPLGKIGGLDNNEVAELVYLEVEASIEYEDDEGGPSVSEFRGVIGANLPADDDGAFPGTGEFQPMDFIESDGDQASTITRFRDNSEDRFFQMFSVRGGAAFENPTNTTGGGGHNHGFYAEKNYRQLTGRGPVLDASDRISIATNFNDSNLSVTSFGVVRVHMVWDVAETSDAGRAFSIPN